MSRAEFSSIKLDDPEFFVVQVKGHLGVKERGRVQELLSKCDEKNKTKIILEFSGLESLGGSVAKLIGGFIAERNQRGLPPAFVGCSDTVKNFLTGRCEKARPEFFKSLKAAQEFLSTTAETPSGNEPEPAVSEPAASRLDGPETRSTESTSPDSESLESVSPESISSQTTSTGNSVEDAAATGADIVLMPDWTGQDGEGASIGAQPPIPDTAEHSSKLRIVEVDKPVPAARYLSLSEAEQTFAAARDLSGMKGAVAALLYGVDLADHCHLMTRKGKELREVGVPEHQLSLNGEVVKKLLETNTPIPMEDLVSESVSDSETELLTDLNCQMAIPVVVDGKLEGALFLRKELAGSEYGPSEVLALDLLGRKLAHALDRGGAALSGNRDDSSPKDGTTANEREMGRKVQQQKALFTIGKEFNSTKDEDHLLSLVLLTTIAQIGVGSVAWFKLEGGRITPQKQRGPEEVTLSPIVVEHPEALRDLTEPCSLDAPDKMETLGKLFTQLKGNGFEFLAPLRGKAGMLGLLALGPRLSGSSTEGIDYEFLSILMNQAGVALENARLIRDLHDRTLGVAQTFVNLIEKRSGPGAHASTELISHYVGQVAKNINYPTDQIRDLVYGTVLRDIGMIEISDLVLRSPRSLTPEEWHLIKQHPVTGVEILSGMNFSATITDVVLYHHERFNGEGYPHGLRGAAIPLGARIVAVVESFVAMTRDLSYRAALSRGEALEVIRENWGMRYDSEVLQAFLEIIEMEGEAEPAIGSLVGAR